MAIYAPRGGLQTLRRAGFDSVLTQARELTEDPWISPPVVVSHTYPDNVARRLDDVFIVDAKYKTPLPSSSPSRDDQYQMFAYSHLVRDSPKQVRAAVLVYPGDGIKARWLRGRDAQAQPVELFAAQIPFPRPSEVSTSVAWNSYLTLAGDRLAQELEIVDKAISRLSA